MKTKFSFWLLATVFLNTCSEAEAQAPSKIPKIGVLVSSSRDSENVTNRAAFQEGLRKPRIHRRIEYYS